MKGYSLRLIKLTFYIELMILMIVGCVVIGIKLVK